jgi:hypothetical protein
VSADDEPAPEPSDDTPDPRSPFDDPAVLARAAAILRRGYKRWREHGTPPPG